MSTFISKGKSRRSLKLKRSLWMEIRRVFFFLIIPYVVWEYVFSQLTQEGCEGEDLCFTQPYPETMQQKVASITDRSLIEDIAVPESLPDDASDITAAVCHKTLFGEIDLFKVYEWVVYHRLLGFDHFFISYIDDVKALPGFDLLDSLPYLTLFENTDAHVIHVHMEDKGNPGKWKNYTRLGGKNRQRKMEAICTDVDAAEYDWVFLADADEYLWWSEQVGLKEFLSKYHDDYDYLSFGKLMYTAKHMVEESGSPFSLVDYPFTPGNYCLKRHPRTGKPRDPCSLDRAKVMVKPSVHKGGVNVHGTHIPSGREGSYSFRTYEAHTKEWNGGTFPGLQGLVRNTSSFVVSDNAEVNLHGYNLSYSREDGTVELYHDSNLTSWFDFVANRGRQDSTSLVSTVETTAVEEEDELAEEPSEATETDSEATDEAAEEEDEHAEESSDATDTDSEATDEAAEEEDELAEEPSEATDTDSEATDEAADADGVAADADAVTDSGVAVEPVGMSTLQQLAVPESLPDDASDITAAVCHKTLFGEIDLFKVYEWVVYHRLLGFDHFFISYIDDVKALPGFDLLDSLPYLTLFENTDAHVIHVHMEDKGNPGKWKNYTRLGGKNRQRKMEAVCTDVDAAEYDWVFLADADEYLWWSEQVGLKEFLSKYHDDYDYLSFGKLMYTAKHMVEESGSPFSLVDYPFTPGNYCLKRHPRTGKPRDPCSLDRAKVMVKPSVHKGGVNVHGTHIPSGREGSYSFRTYEAHTKEWNGGTFPGLHGLVRNTSSFVVSDNAEVNIHGYNLSYSREDGTVELYHDSNLTSWFDFVAHRGRQDSTSLVSTVETAAVEEEDEHAEEPSETTDTDSEAADDVAADADDVAESNVAVEPAGMSTLQQIAVPESLPDDTSDITAAVCHKTLFGEIDLYKVYEWVVYHRLLGFDHFFISYIDEVKALPGFDLLNSLPYLTLFENTDAHVIHVLMEDKGNPGKMKNYTRLGGTNRQRVMEAQCTDVDAVGYDWVFLADADEYLWFDQAVGLKEFLSEFHDDYDYLSFGKQMYTAKHMVETASAPAFSLSDYPFTPGNYCLNRYPKSNLPRMNCPKDRAKVMVKPSVHKGGVNVHGTHVPDHRQESLHFLTPRAHVKEWNGGTFPNLHGLVRDATSFVVSDNAQVNLHGFDLSYSREDGTVELYYDGNLSTWFDFVASRGQDVASTTQ